MEEEAKEAQAGDLGEVSREAVERGGLDLVSDVPLRLTVEVGSARMLVREVLQLGKGAVIELDRNQGDPSDVLVNGRLLARGEVTVVDDRLAVRIVEVIRGEPPEAGTR
jgi:flagellar motor switch protein FliN/FliY